VVRKRVGGTARTDAPGVVDESGLLSDLGGVIQSARQRIASVAYSTQTLLSWHLGHRLLKVTLRGKRAAYGMQILVTVSQRLTAEYGRGFSHPEITRMVQFAQLFPEENIVVTLSQQLSWSHFHALLPIKDALAREFYAEMCRVERWNVRTLRHKIGGSTNAPRARTLRSASSSARPRMPNRWSCCSSTPSPSGSANT
jgi:hypothetical protein